MKTIGVIAGISFGLAFILIVVLIVTTSPGKAGNICGPAGGPVNVNAIPADAKVGVFERDQLANAGEIMNAAAALKLPAGAGTLGIQAAIGESTLDNIQYGDFETSGVLNPDGTPTSSIGLFQQQDWWGTLEQRMDPFSSATLFFTALIRDAPGWEAMDTSIAINAVQGNLDPYHYSKYQADAVQIADYLSKLGGGNGSGGGCSVSGDGKALAEGLVVAMQNGSLTMLETRYADQLTNMANGTAVDGCMVDVRVLQLITMTLNSFESVGVSDLNRRCTGSLEGAGTGSPHYFKGGGLAVDFYALNGTPLDGANADNMKLLDLLATVAPEGTRAGQDNCRAGEQWANVTQFYDRCNHQHIDFGYTDLPLNVTA